MDAIFYLLEANTYLLVFYLLYKILFKKETFNSLNRFYLLSISIFSFILPLFQVGFFKKPEIQTTSIHIPQNGMIVTTYLPTTVGYTEMAIVIYLGVALLMLIKLCVKLCKIYQIICKNKVQSIDDFKLVELSTNGAFSFFNYLFVNPDSSHLEKIIKHELVHIRQFHSVDIIIFEILHILNWPNPLYTILKNEIKAVHEFLADEFIIDTDIDRELYSKFLITHSSEILSTASLGNQMFTQTLLKKRILRIYQKKSDRRLMWKYLIIFPVIGCMIIISSVTFAKSYGRIDFFPTKAYSSQINTMPSPTDYTLSLSGQTNLSLTARKSSAVTSTILKKRSPHAFPVDKPKVNQYRSTKDLYNIWINAVTDTVKIRKVSALKSKPYKGIYVIDGKIYSQRQLNSAMNSNGELDIILPHRPIIGVYTENDQNAIAKWGRKAVKGVVFVQSRLDTLNR